MSLSVVKANSNQVLKSKLRDILSHRIVDKSTTKSRYAKINLDLCVSTSKQNINTTDVKTPINKVNKLQSKQSKSALKETNSNRIVVHHNSKIQKINSNQPMSQSFKDIKLRHEAVMKKATQLKEKNDERYDSTSRKSKNCNKICTIELSQNLIEINEKEVNESSNNISPAQTLFQKYSDVYSSIKASKNEKECSDNIIEQESSEAELCETENLMEQQTIIDNRNLENINITFDPNNLISKEEKEIGSKVLANNSCTNVNTDKHMKQIIETLPSLIDSRICEFSRHDRKQITSFFKFEDTNKLIIEEDKTKNNPKDLTLIKPIGSGSFGTVYLWYFLFIY